MTFTKRHYISIAILRMSLGMLLVWWGLHRIVAPVKGVGLQNKFYFGMFPSESMQYAFGFVELAIGLLVVVGLFRKFAVPAQLMITGFSAMTIITALLDPFALWLPFDKVAPVQHLFYPSVIALAAAVFLFLLREQDRLSLDHLIASMRKSDEPPVVPAE